MKVSITKRSKNIISLAEASTARKIVEEMKRDEMSIAEYAEIAARVAGGSDEYEILKASAEITKNARVCNRYGEDTNDLDIWIDFYAFSRYKGFFEVGVYLSDICDICISNAEEIKSHMYINHYHR